MRITDLLDKRSISLDGAPKNKQEALDMAIDLMKGSDKINDQEAYRKQVYKREEEGTTGIGMGIAIPHGKCNAVDRPGLAAMVIKDGVDFDSLDGEPVHLLFLIAAPDTEDNIHLEVLSKLSMMLMDDNFTQSLKNASSVDEFMEIINKADEERPDLSEQFGGSEEAPAEEKQVKRRDRASDLYTVDERCVSYASIRGRRRYSDRTGILDRWTLRRYECTGTG